MPISRFVLRPATARSADSLRPDLANRIAQVLWGYGDATGTVRRNTVGSLCQLQALGEEGIEVTPLELVLAYARLSKRLQDEKFAPVREGLEGAVEFGTAQAAQVHGLQVAGKTGSILLRSGAPAAWFAGFAPSRLPRIAVAVLTPGRSGGADAAPIAARLMERYVNVT